MLLAFLKLEDNDLVLKERLKCECSDFREHTVVICEVFGPTLIRGGGMNLFFPPRDVVFKSANYVINATSLRVNSSLEFANFNNLLLTYPPLTHPHNTIC